MADMKTIPTRKSISEYIKTIEPEGRRREAKSLLPIMRRASGKRPVLWESSIIGYGKYHYVYKTGREGDWFLTGFALRKSAISIYIMPGFGDFGDHLKKLGKHKTSVSCLYVKKLDDIDLNVLENLVTASVEKMHAIYTVA